MKWTYKKYWLNIYFYIKRQKRQTYLFKFIYAEKDKIDKVVNKKMALLGLKNTNHADKNFFKEKRQKYLC